MKEAGGHGGSLLPCKITLAPITAVGGLRLLNCDAISIDGKAAPAAMLQRLTRRAPYYEYVVLDLSHWRPLYSGQTAF